MSNFIESKISELDNEIERVQTELSSLTAARTALASEIVVEDTKTVVSDDLAEQRLANLKKAREAKAAKATGQQSGPSRADQILGLLAKGNSVADVAKALNISKGYVYNTRNRAQHAA